MRLSHWTLVVAFAVCWLTEEEILGLHTWSGYLIACLVVARILWGFAGSRHARFVDFIYPPADVMRFLADTLRLRAQRYLGHNPAAGVMVTLLILSVGACALSGMLLYGMSDQAGPLWFFYEPRDGFVLHRIERIHGLLADFTVVLVVLHVSGVIIESVIHRENLVKAMVTGFKPDHEIKSHCIEEKI